MQLALDFGGRLASAAPLQTSNLHKQLNPGTNISCVPAALACLACYSWTAP